MTYPSTPAAPPAKPKGLLVAGLVLMALAVVVLVGGTVWTATTVSATATDAPAFEAPGTVTTTLEAGEHAIWTNSAYLFPDDVTITGPGGAVTGVDYTESEGIAGLTRDGTSFSPEVTFDAATTGSYTVTVAEGGPSTDVLVGPPTNIGTRAFATVAVAFLASCLIGFVGLVLLIVGLVRRSRAKRRQGPPPGAYGAPGPYGGPGPYGAPGPYPHPTSP